MRFLFTFLSLFISIQLLASPESDSGIFGPTYKNILNETEKWANEYPELVQIIDYGKSVKGRPLRMVLVMKQMHVKSRPAFLMSGSTHGNEFLAIETSLPLKLLEKQRIPGAVKNFLDHGGVFVFIPILNPDGYESRERENANGIDLNRDWDLAETGFKGFTQPETQQLAEYLEKLTQPPFNLNFKVTVDYHCCVGAILYPWSYTKKKLPEPDLSHHIELAEIAKKFLSIDYGTTGEILGYYPQGTTKDYYYSKYNSLTYTYEGRYQEENKYLESHVKWWEAIVSDTLKRITLASERLTLLNFPFLVSFF